ncbi:D-alanine--D-alanine ligase A [Ammoniphilus oxalaticus]|uniref:D-alanine--D-alanine ligase n=1 Tax=Ammoniphilus oxalaticus TaxID=66863 RepID=A0A419SJ70_9BACL|nr:D-alanine--D-alanine ligase [Ammoniphilus oxalaticus]RKD23996.1 D-alanine--D-alanine ligase A [Ammoniphilus oxalaticus]
MSKTRLGIIYGGKSSEHEVSLNTALAIMNAVDFENYEVIPIYISLDGVWAQGVQISQKVQSVDELRFSAITGQQPNVFHLKGQIDIAFPVIHGPFGEDGTIQGLLEMVDIPYVGTGVLGSALGMDKVAMKNVFGEVGLPQCNYLSYVRTQLQEEKQTLLNEIEQQIGYPCFVKPANMGSSVGISKAKDRQSLEEALRLASQFDRKIIVEENIEGREVEIGVLGNETLRVSVVGEIVSSNEFYDYEAKYKNAGTELIIPAQLPEGVIAEVARLAKKAFRALDASGLSRIDFFWDEQNDRVLINEINTMPGFTPFSMYPMLFQETGVSYRQLIDELIKLGFERYRDRNSNTIVAEKFE